MCNRGGWHRGLSRPLFGIPTLIQRNVTLGRCCRCCEWWRSRRTCSKIPSGVRGGAEIPAAIRSKDSGRGICRLRSPGVVRGLFRRSLTLNSLISLHEADKSLRFLRRSDPSMAQQFLGRWALLGIHLPNTRDGHRSKTVWRGFHQFSHAPASTGPQNHGTLVTIAPQTK